MNNKQIKLLKEINKAGLYDYSHLTADERNTLFYLRSIKYVTTNANPNDDPRPLYKITELGKSQLYNSKQGDFRFWFPLIISNCISIIALVISIIALLK